MKKLLLVVLLIAFAFSGCQKKTVPMKEFDSSTLKSISTKYLDKLNSSSQGVNPMFLGIHIRLSKRALRIIGKDLQGLGSGAAAGAGAGAVIAGVGAGPGAVVGGVIGAAGASLYEAGKQTDAPKKETSYDPISNSNNPFDSVGFEHYHLINEALGDSLDYLSNGNYDNPLFYNFSSNLAVLDGVVEEQSLAAFPITSSDSVLSIVANADDDLVTYFTGIPTYDSVVKSCLTPYLQCFEASENAEVGGFVEYSIQMENAVINMGMSDFDKQIILSVMATARYGVQYWPLQY